MTYQQFLLCWWIRAPMLSHRMLLVRFLENRCFALVQQFWFVDWFVWCISRPFDDNSRSLRNHIQIENVEIAQCFSYFFDIRSNHIECVLPTNKNSWACWTHRQIEKCWNYTMFFMFFEIILDCVCPHFRIPEHLDIVETLTNVNISLDQCKKTIL